MSKKAKKPVEVVEKVVLEVPSPASYDDARRLSALGNLERLRALVASSTEGPQAVIAEKDDLGFTPLAWAAKNGHSAVVSFLVKECDADIESEAAGRAKPIHLAVNGSHEASLAILVAAKADVNSTDELGNTALHLCVCVGGSLACRAEEAEGIAVTDRSFLSPARRCNCASLHRRAARRYDRGQSAQRACVHLRRTFMGS